MDWYGPAGWFGPNTGRYFIGEGISGTGSAFRWSMLYSYPALVHAVSIIGIFASLAMLLGLGSRLSPLIAWGAMGMFHHRAPFLTLLHEPLLNASLVYLMIEPGRRTWTVRPGLASGTDRVSANIPIRLIMIHLWIWMAFSLASMLANDIWWTGEAGSLLIQTNGGSRVFPAEWPILSQFLAHFIITLQIAFLACMLQPTWRWMSRWLIYLFALCILLLLVDWMYAATLLAMSFAPWPPKS